MQAVSIVTRQTQIITAEKTEKVKVMKIRKKKKALEAIIPSRVETRSPVYFIRAI